MPSAQIDIRREYSQDEETAIIAAVHGAMVSALKIPEKDRHVRLVVHEPHRFACPPDKQHPDRYTQVTIDAFAGRSPEAKRALYAAIVEALEPLGIPRDHVMIIVRDLPLESWGLRGGVPATDVELGFRIDV